MDASLPNRSVASGAARRERATADGGAVRLKRVYEPPTAGDGVRILIDRLWPRGLSRERVAADLWLKDAAPSDALRRWFGHAPSRWTEFVTRYRAELEHKPELTRMLAELRRRGPITLLYAARDPARNNAIVLRAVIERQRRATARTQQGVER